MAELYPFELRQTPIGWTVHINGINQPFDPDLPGDVPMDNTRAYKVLYEFAVRLGFDDTQLPEPLEIPLVP